MKPSELLCVPEKWIKLDAAIDDFGREVNSLSPTACRFSLSGALNRESLDRKMRVAWLSRLAVHIRIHFGERVRAYRLSPNTFDSNEALVQFFNDHEDTTYADVMKVLHSAGM